MIIRSCELEEIIGPSSAIPVHSLPEFAFAGRSNVGKSSLINALMQRKSLARTSSQPGKTRTINFYNINGELYFADLPGYGFAKVSDREKEAWGRMVGRYMRTSSTLKAVFLLADIRHDPTGGDRAMLEMVLGYGVPAAVIATKADKVSRNALPKQLKAIRQGLRLEKDVPIIATSADAKTGLEEVWQFIEKSM